MTLGLSSLGTKFKKQGLLCLLIFLILLMFYPYTYLSWSQPTKFYSPDETANYLFTKEFIQNNRLYFTEALNPLAGNILLPRSFNISGDKLVPQSFLGLPALYGILGKITGTQAIVFFTPLLSLFAVLLLHGLVKKIFSQRTAFWSAIFLLFNPIFWYNAARAFNHVNLFIFFLILGLFWLYIYFQKKQATILAAAGLSLGTALMVRPTEAVWVIILILAIIWFQRKNILKRDLLWLGLPFILMLVWILALNYQTFGHIFSLGYNSLDSSAINALPSFTSWLLPFGFNLKAIGLHLGTFIVKYLWFFFLPFIFGLIYILKNKKDLTTASKTYVITTSILFLYLIIYYGSYWLWGQSGQPEQLTLSIGAPHLRYWLPIMVLLLPLMAEFWLRVIPKIFNLKNAKARLIIITLFTLLLLGYSFQQVFFSADEGLLKIKQDVAEFSPRLDNLKTLVPNNAVLLIPAWADRIFFPDYAVVQSIEDPKIHAGDIFSQVQTLTRYRPIYYYSASSSEDIDQLNQSFNKARLNLNLITEVYKGERLYKVNPF